MKKRLFWLGIFVGVIFLCSCRDESSTVSTNSTDSGLAITPITISTTDSSTEAEIIVSETSPTIETASIEFETPDDVVFVRDYFPLDYLPEIIRDENNRLVGSYDNINFDVNVFTDVNTMPSVGVFSVLIDNRPISAPIGWSDIGFWNYYYHFGTPTMHAVQFGEGYENSPDQDVLNVANTLNTVDIDDVEVLDGIRGMLENRGIPLSNSVISYCFNPLNIPGDIVTAIDGGFASDIDSATYYCVRPEYGSLPVTTYVPASSSVMLSLGDGYIGATNAHGYNLYSSEYSGLVSIYPYWKEIYQQYEENITPVSIDSCIGNVIPEIMFDVSDSNAEVDVFAAELNYVLTYEWIFGQHDWETGFGLYTNPDDGRTLEIGLLLPVWQVYYGVKTSEGYDYIGSVFLSAITGEGAEINSSYFLENWPDRFFSDIRRELSPY